MVLARFRAAGLKISLKKCQFFKEEVNYLGHVVSADGVKPNPSTTSAILNFPKPSNIKEMRGFLGLVGYYRRFIPDFAKHAKPLTMQLKSKAPYIWSSEQEVAFNFLKTSLTAEEFLKITNIDEDDILNEELREELIEITPGDGHVQYNPEQE